MDMYRVQVIVCIGGLMLLSCTGCASSTATDDAWFGQDKALHFGYSAFIGVGGSAVAHRHYRASEASAYTIGMLSVISLGGLKEWYDLQIKGSYWSWKDVFWDLLGGAAGSFLGIRIR